MSEKPKWMPSDDEIRREFYENIYRESAAVHCDRVAYRAGLRAQAAVLEELIAGQTGHMVDRAKELHQVKANIRAAELRAEDVVRAGHYPIVPHLCTAYLDGLAPDQHFLDGTLEAMKRCDEVWLCEGWRDSHGSKLEVATAIASGIPVKDIDGSRVHLLTIHAERRRKK